MRVTPEMILRATRVRDALLGLPWSEVLPAVIEAALAPLPDQWHEWADIADERLLQLSEVRRESAQLQSDLRAAEAKLEKVRALLERDPYQPLGALYDYEIFERPKPASP